MLLVLVSRTYGHHLFHRRSRDELLASQLPDLGQEVFHSNRPLRDALVKIVKAILESRVFRD